MTDEEPTTLYRLYDRAGTLLYVGIARSWIRRLAQHRHHQLWWPAVTTVRLQAHETRAAALAAEADAIHNERPVHNITHRARPVVHVPDPRRVDPQWHKRRAVACTFCGAPPGAMCVTKDGKTAANHHRRGWEVA